MGSFEGASFKLLWLFRRETCVTLIIYKLILNNFEGKKIFWAQIQDSLVSYAKFLTQWKYHWETSAYSVILLLIDNLFLEFHAGNVVESGLDLEFSNFWSSNVGVVMLFRYQSMKKLSRRAFFVRGKMPNPYERLSAHQVYYKTLNLIFSASKQYIKNLDGNFGAIRIGIMHAKFQPLKLQWCGRRRRWQTKGRIVGRQAFLNRSLYKISKLPPRFALEG